MGKFRAYDFEPEDEAEAGRKFHLTRFREVLLDTTAAYLIKDLIPSGGLTVVWGPPKCGKSFWTFDAMMHVARGVPYRGRRVQQGPVVYIALEGGNGFRRRIEAYRRHHGVTDAPFYLITDRTDLVRDHEALIADIKEQTPVAPVAVVIDTLNRSIAGSESSDEDMAAYIKAADAVREAFGCAVIIVHHCGVDGSRPRGHTSLTGAADAQIAVSRNEATNDVVATLEWLKDGAEGDVITGRLELIELGLDEDGEPTNSCVIVPAEVEPQERPTKPKKSEPRSVKAFRAAFTEALDTLGQNIRVRGDGPFVRAVDLRHVRRQFELRWATGENDPDKKADARRKAFKRLTDKTMPADFATCVEGDVEWIWTTK
jgi:hypothetical protein